uniref:Uncharacterized protein n=1 Tax=Anguilla anguilla TaxID=7936 RepID=A0A0E9UXW2_ANGAN
MKKEPQVFYVLHPLYAPGLAARFYEDLPLLFLPCHSCSSSSFAQQVAIASLWFSEGCRRVRVLNV